MRKEGEEYAFASNSMGNIVELSQDFAMTVMNAVESTGCDYRFLEFLKVIDRIVNLQIFSVLERVERGFSSLLVTCSKLAKLNFQPASVN